MAPAPAPAPVAAAGSFRLRLFEKMAEHGNLLRGFFITYLKLHSIFILTNVSILGAWLLVLFSLIR